MGDSGKGTRNQQLIVKLVLIAIASVVVTAVIQVVLSVTEISSVNDKLVMVCISLDIPLTEARKKFP